MKINSLFVWRKMIPAVVLSMIIGQALAVDNKPLKCKTEFMSDPLLQRVIENAAKNIYKKDRSYKDE